MSVYFLICDLQVKFRPAIHGFDHVVATTSKMLRFAKLMEYNVIVTTQNIKALGPVDPSLDIDSLGALCLGTIDKTLFSMLTEEVTDRIGPNPSAFVIMGIESHICVLQTTMDLRKRYPDSTVYVLADGVSSCNPHEVPIAFERLRLLGAVVTTSESLAFQFVGDASHPKFREFARLVKEEKEQTRLAGQFLIPTNNIQCTAGNLKSSI
ncbi:Isochorismatase hydrolase [Dendrothele bispora CBS 962.96]|uniref:Isochorismatase hydrolase n=1 Tax=Dendrothele bispora (strain CBS 962.96) TaxID=1314807 RepID=A0A4S8L632_DENBC|nr:Isochorismatase hydrolase [Dendrothele bispora CBS 962.96]